MRYIVVTEINGDLVEYPFTGKKYRSGQEARYAKESRTFRIMNPMCKINAPGCTHNTDCVHHAKGRIGHLLLDKRWWIPSCGHCNKYVEDNHNWARMMGFKVDSFQGPFMSELDKVKSGFYDKEMD